MSARPAELRGPENARTLTPQTRERMRTIIVGQCYGSLGGLAFRNNLILLYLAAMGVDRSTNLMLHSFYPLVLGVLMVGSAFLADALGKKRVGMWGHWGCILGFAVIMLAGARPEWAATFAAVGILVFSTGETLLSGGWFALLSPIVPDFYRGRFFGWLRVSWQLAGVGFVALMSYMLDLSESLPVYEMLMALCLLGLGLRIPYYMRVPELEPPRGPGPLRIMATLKTVARTDGVASFCAYIFLIYLCTGGVQWVFSLLEKDVLGFSDSLVATMGNVLMIGSVLGYFLGGLAVDRFGTRMVFIGCHLALGLTIGAFVGRDFLPGSLPAALGVVTFLFGLATAAVSIAVTSETLGIIGPENKSVSTSLCSTLNLVGMSLSAFLSAKALGMGFLKETWTLAGRPMSDYDTVLLGCAIMVMLLIVTLGLVPSVIRQAQWIPKADRPD